MIDYEAVIKNMDLRYAELYADLKSAEFALYKAYAEMREMRERPDIAVAENEELRKLLVEARRVWAASENEKLVEANRRVVYAAKLLFKVIQYARGRRSAKTLPKWVQKELGGWFGMDWVTDVTWGEPK